MKKFSEMTDIGFKRVMTKVRKTDATIKKIAKRLRCNPEEIVDRIQRLLADIEAKKAELQKLKDKLK